MKIHDEANESLLVCRCIRNDACDPGAWEAIPFWSALLDAFSDSDASGIPNVGALSIRTDLVGKRRVDAGVSEPKILAITAHFGYSSRFVAWFNRRKTL